MAENFSESSHIESANIGVDRTAATVKGGRRFSFGALVVVGDRRGRVGFGYGKSNEVPSAIEKAEKYARKAMVSVPLSGTTIQHQVEGTFSACKVRLVPAAPGTGVVAGGVVRTILEKAGVTDCLTKCYGSTNARNIVKAVFLGLSPLRQPGQVGTLRRPAARRPPNRPTIEAAGHSASCPPDPRRPAARQHRRRRRRARSWRPGGGGGGGRVAAARVAKWRRRWGWWWGWRRGGSGSTGGPRGELEHSGTQQPKGYPKRVPKRVEDSESSVMMIHEVTPGRPVQEPQARRARHRLRSRDALRSRQKGARRRSGHATKKAFEGGQMPYYRRLPKFGFTNPFNFTASGPSTFATSWSIRPSVRAVR